MFRVIADAVVKGPVSKTSLHPALVTAEVHLGLARYFVAKDLEHAFMACQQWVGEHYDVVSLDVISVVRENTKLLVSPTQLDVRLSWNEDKGLH